MTQVTVEIERFSGPLALLLHLIRQEEMDIFDININEITKQYLESIKQMKKLNLETAGEFIAMAATLIQIKSKMLLPQYNEQGEVVEQEDPRKDLVRRLLEYQMYQEAGQNLYRRPLLNRDVWARSPIASKMERERIETPESEIVLEEGNALYSLIAAYRHAIKNMKKAVHRVAGALQSIAERIWELRDRLIVGRQVKLFDLVDDEGDAAEGVNPMKGDRRGRLLITFLSLLEMAKLGVVRLFQSENFADIHIDTLKPIDRDMISRVESYEAADNNGAVKEILLTEEDQADVEEAQGGAASDQSSSSQLELTAQVLDGMGEGDGLGAVDADGATESQVVYGPGATYADRVEDFDQEYEVEAATDEEILAEELRLMASVNNDGSTFATTELMSTDEGSADGEKAEEVEA